MAKCCGSEDTKDGGVFAHFRNMIDNCLDYAKAQRDAGKPIVGILCEFTPRELIMAAGAVPVCLCGGSASTIPDAEKYLPSNLCPLIKSTFGYHVQKSNPFLEMADLIVAETTCDGKKKMYELMAESREVYVLELPQKQDDTDAFDYWLKEIHKFKCVLEERFGVEVTEDGLRKAIELMNRERHLRRDLASLMKLKNPPLTGRQLLELKSSISGVELDLCEYEKVLEELKSRTVPENSNIRVLLTGVPIVHGVERVVDIIEQSGATIVAMENCTGLKPILEDVDDTAPDPIRAIAEKYFHLPCSVMTSNDARIELLSNLAKEYNCECIIDLIWQACLTYDVESYRVEKLAREELDLPYMKIETDYSPSDSSRIAVRVEALFETIRSRKDTT